MDLGILLSSEFGDRKPDLRIGVVTSITPLKVRIGSLTGADAKKLASYSGPAIGHVVAVLVLPGYRLVLGNVG